MTAAQTIRVVLADDHPVVRNRLATIIDQQVVPFAAPLCVLLRPTVGYCEEDYVTFAAVRPAPIGGRPSGPRTDSPGLIGSRCDHSNAKVSLHAHRRNDPDCSEDSQASMLFKR